MRTSRRARYRVSVPAVSPTARLVLRRGLAAALVVALLAVPFAVPSLAASGSRSTPAHPTTTIVHARVSRPGRYLVVVRFPTITMNEAVSVSVGSQKQSNVPLYANAPAALSFYVSLASTKFRVRCVSSGPALRFTVGIASTSAPSRASTTGPSGTTGATGATGTTGATGDIEPTLLTAPPTGPYQKLVWSDEFDGPAGAPPDPSRWTPDQGGSCGVGTLSTNTQDPANASTDGAGGLGITALQQGPTAYTSAQLDTEYKFSFKYGRILARIEQPVGQGLCSAFWLEGDGPTLLSSPCWPGCGEIDVMEMLGQTPNLAYSFLHGPLASGGNFEQWGAADVNTTPLTSGYHVYGVTWQRGSITWTLDGIPYATATPKSLAKGSTWVFDNFSAHIILDLGVGGWPGPPSPATSFPATMRVDWVRVYQ